MAIEFDPTSKLFQIDYQSPFGGIDSSAYASAIDPHNFAAMGTGVNNANKLTPISWAQVINETQSSTQSYLGYIPVADSSTIGYIITTEYVIIVTSNGTGGLNYTSAGPYSPAVSTFGYFSYVVIGNQIIWTSETWSEIWSYNAQTQVLSNLTTYVGGGYLGILDNQLINLGGISAADGPVPYRISWSAPGEYGVFQPYAISTNTGSYAAGFNDLPSTSDTLVGIITLGTVAYLFRSQGITQMNPTGNGIDPFSFNHLWASQLGIGTVLPDSISQYGVVGAFIADSGIYTMSLDGIADISGQAKDLLFGVINNISTFAQLAALPQGIITAQCVPYLLSHPSTYYVIGIADSMVTTGALSSVGSYHIYALDIAQSSACYDLGVLPVATGTAATRGVGKLSFINNNYISAPQPYPVPNPPAQSSVAGAITSPFTGVNYGADYEISGAQIRTLGSIGYGVITNYVVASIFGAPAVPLNAVIQGVRVGTNWIGQNDAAGTMTSVGLYYQGALIGTPKSLNIANTAVASDLSEGSLSDSWGTPLTPAIVNDPTFGAGFQVTTAPLTGSTRSFFNSFNITVYYIIPSVRPTYLPQVAYVSNVVPLFVAINNDVAGNDTFVTTKLTPPSDTAVGLFVFRKEQFKLAMVPTVTRIAFIASLIDQNAVGRIQVSIDGGANYGTRIGPSNETLGFTDITVFPGFIPQAANDLFSTVFSDGVVSIERPQLAIKLTNVTIAEAWYQGTFADYAVI